MRPPAEPPPQPGTGDKGLRPGALGFLSGVVIGVSSTAPGYSLASALGGIAAVAGMGEAAPAVMLLAFVPMLFTAAAYYFLNRADPDCGTTFAWGTRAFGPWVGWIGGWGIVVANIIVLGNLAQISGEYTYMLFDATPSTVGHVVVGVVWIILMSWICYIGIEASAIVQYLLLLAEIAVLLAFSGVALWKVYALHPAGSVAPALHWFNPLALGGLSTLAQGLIVAIFIYWGWDSTVTVNEESADARHGPGKAAIWSTVILLGIYVAVTVAAQAFHGTAFLADPAHQADVLGALAQEVLGTPWDKLLIIAVLTSAAACTQTAILPTTRTALSMAKHLAAPEYFGRVHATHMTPSVATVWMGVVSILWYVGLSLASTHILADSIAGLGLAIAYYYGLTALACPWYFRRQLLRSVKHFVLLGAAPLIGGATLAWALVYSLGTLPPGPLRIFFGMMAFGVVLMAVQFSRHPEFFRRRAEQAADDSDFGEPHARDGMSSAT